MMSRMIKASELAPFQQMGWQGAFQRVWEIEQKDGAIEVQLWDHEFITLAPDDEVTVHQLWPLDAHWHLILWAIDRGWPVSVAKVGEGTTIKKSKDKGALLEATAHGHFSIRVHVEADCYVGAKVEVDLLNPSADTVKQHTACLELYQWRDAYGQHKAGF